MIMRKPFITIALLFTFFLSYSQMRVAILGGPVSASVKEKNSLPGWDTDIKPGYTHHAGLHLGVLLEMPINHNFSFQPGIMYMAKGRKYFMNNDTAASIISDTMAMSSNLSVNYIEAPLNIAYRVPLAKKINFMISAGPYIGFFYNGSQRNETRIYSSNNIKSENIKLETGSGTGKVKTVDIGWNARAGFEIGSLMVSGFMSQGLTNFYKASYDGTFKHHVVGASLGFWLNKLAKPEKAKPIVLPVKSPVDTIAFKDTDGDGISDEADQCPTEPGTPEFNGCPVPDTDGDGLIDTEDKCPTEYGPKSNGGCPVKKDTSISEIEKRVKLAAKRIFFNANSDQLTLKSTDPLDEIITLLQEYPSLKIIIEGHTDASGKAESNKILSQKRAEAVQHYLIVNGIDASRLSAVGYGSENPLDTNKTPEGRARNRRVEFSLVR